MIKKRRRGRPLNYKLSAESKLAISMSKLGHKHSEETKTKISKSLLGFYKRKYPLSEELLSYYHENYGEDVASWICKNSDKIDCLDDIVTDRYILNSRRRELEFNNELNYFTVTNNYEYVLDLKKLLLTIGLEVDTKEVFDTLLLLVEEMCLSEILDSMLYLLKED